MKGTGNRINSSFKDVPLGIFKKFSIAIFLIAICSIQTVRSSNYNNRFICRNSQCRRAEYLNGNEVVYSTIELCRLICGEDGALWPKPDHVRFTDRNLIAFNPSNIIIRLASQNDNEMSRKITNIFRENLLKECGTTCNSQKKMQLVISITFSSNSKHLDWDTEESYSLSVTHKNDTTMEIVITGTNIYGARHALETLTQLVTSFPEADNTSCLAIIKGVKINDRPAYAHRGLLLDTSRNFLSIKTIKKHIQAMGASKMNFLHWHITDSHSFPMETPSVPNMTLYGAYSNTKIYKYQDIKDLIQYALYRGVRIILELDAPAHAGFGWQWGAEAGLGNLAVCVNHQPWRAACIQPPCGQLNPSNPEVYNVLEKIYRDMLGLLPWSEIFHMGGDELYIPCWNITEEIIRYIGNKTRSTETFLDLWAEFQQKALSRYDKVVGNNNSKVIVWTSHLTDPNYIEEYLDKNRYIIQTWVESTDDLPDQLLKKGYELIISTKNAWYLDHGFWGNTKYYDWRAVYQNQIHTSSDVLGGEVCMWGEYVDDSSVIGRTWPRAAAAAERLWSNPGLHTYQVEARFYRHRERLVNRGIGADAIIPRWCYYNEGQC